VTAAPAPAAKRPPLARGLVYAGKVVAAFAGAGAILGAVACGTALVAPSGTPYSGPAFVGFFVLLASVALGVMALGLYALGLALDPPRPPPGWAPGEPWEPSAAARTSRALLGVGGGLLVLLVLAALAGVFTGSSLLFDLPGGVPPQVLVGAACVLVVVGLLLRTDARR
jgi:hypothetical protein